MAVDRKPYVKVASTMVLVGAGLFTLERMGLARLEGPNRDFHIHPVVLSLLVIVPLALVAVGALVFVVGKIRRL